MDMVAADGSKACGVTCCEAMFATAAEAEAHEEMGHTLVFLQTVHGLNGYYAAVAFYVQNGIPWEAKNRQDGGWDFYRFQ